jgi:hypothetical protein
MSWIQAVERDDPDPAGRRVPVGERVHAYNDETREPAHPTVGNLLVRTDSWFESARGQRCQECVNLIPPVRHAPNGHEHFGTSEGYHCVATCRCGEPFENIKLSQELAHRATLQQLEVHVASGS